jgi:hypothetical protein
MPEREVRDLRRCGGYGAQLGGEPMASLWRRLCDDHQQLDAVLNDVQQLTEERAFSTASKRFGEFRLREERHLRTEAQLLRLLESLSDPPQIVQALREEHRQLHALLEEATHALGRRDGAAFCAKLSALQQTMTQHLAEERDALLPKLDEELDEELRYHLLVEGI